MDDCQDLENSQAIPWSSAIAQLLETLQADPPSAQLFHSAFIAVPLKEEDAALSVLVGRYRTLGNLLPTLREWALQGHSDAVSELAQVVANIPEVNAVEALNYFEMVATLPEQYRHQCAMYLAEQLPSDVAATCCDTLCAQTSFNENQAQAWAIASACNDPIGALSIVTHCKGLNASRLRFMILELVRIDQQPVVEAILNQEKAHVALLLDVANDPAFALRAWAILARIASISALAQEAVRDAVAHGRVEAIHGHASSLLSAEAVSRLPGEDFLQLIRVMLPFSMEDANLLAKIDLLISLRLRNKAGKHDSFAALTYCASVQGFDPVKRLRRCFDHLRSQPLLHGQLLTYWLLNLAISHGVVRSALNDCPVGKVPPLDVTVLAQAGAQGQRNVVRRILALFHDGQSLCMMAAVFIESSQLQPLGIELGAEMLHLTWREYSREVEEFLDERVKQVKRRSAAGKLYTNITANAARWKKVLEQLPEAGELAISMEKRRLLRLIEQRHARDIMRQAESKSFFGNLFQSSYSAQGSRVAVGMPDGSVNVISLHQHRQSISLPSSELCDPLGGHMIRQTMLKEME